jgi:hypothetical protein
MEVEIVLKSMEIPAGILHAHVVEPRAFGRVRVETEASAGRQRQTHAHDLDVVRQADDAVRQPAQALARIGRADGRRPRRA